MEMCKRDAAGCRRDTTSGYAHSCEFARIFRNFLEVLAHLARLPTSSLLADSAMQIAHQLR